VAGYTACQQLYQLEGDVLPFKPNAVIWVGHHLEERSIVRYLANRLHSGAELPYDYPYQVFAEAGARPEMSEEEIGRRLTPYGPELVTWVYGEVTRLAAENGFTPVWVYLPVFVGSSAETIKAELMEHAREAGFHVFDLSAIYDGHDLAEITVAEWDHHPNGLGNVLIAQALYQAFLEDEAIALEFGLAP
jgi:hypothetical protein